MTDTETHDEPIEVTLTARRSDARATWDGTTMRVRAGSTGPIDMVASFSDSDRARRTELITDGTLEVDGDVVRFTRDTDFSSPTAAAAMLMGRPNNGWNHWKDGDGIPIGSRRRSPGDVAQIAFTRRWFERHRVGFNDDASFQQMQSENQRRRTADGAEALRLLAQLGTDRDAAGFVEAMQAWSAGDQNRAFNGFSGQMLLNQLAKQTESSAALADLLIDVLSPPADSADAVRKINRLVDHIEEIRVGHHPAPGRAPFFVSYFWALADHETWPVIWTSGASFAEFLIGRSLPAAPSERYEAFRTVIGVAAENNLDFEFVGAWWHDHHPVLLDGVLVERCAFGRDRDAVDPDALASNADVLVGVAQHISTQLVDQVSASAGFTLQAAKPGKYWANKTPRSDTWADWRAEPHELGIRLWITETGVLIGLNPGMIRAGWYDDAVEIIERSPVAGFEFVGARGSELGDGPSIVGGRSGQFVYARRYEPDALADLDVKGEVTGAAVALQPLLDELVAAAGGVVVESTDDDPLAEAVAQFRERYPTPADEDHRAAREQFAQLIANDSIALADPAELRRIWNTQRYGGPGPQSILNTSLRDADAAEFDRISDSIRYLLWGDGDDADRIDALLDQDGDRYVRGLGESVVMKLLAIARPDRYLPVFPYGGPKGKLAMLQMLGIDEPDSDTRGQLQVVANDLLRNRLGRFFPGDAWGAAQFLYRYAERDDEVPDDFDGVDRMERLADELLVDRSFLDDLVALLEDKRQIILYGPPGTGKTYLAQKLAEVLAPDLTRRALVQFHPSMSYEDFVEGYRPEPGADGALSYRLTPGPLALLAQRAADSPGKRHVMVIDEINRANLPRVLGELLFLLEYRDTQIPTLYRPDDPFELPSDLWFIGTMNTADRSIALIDAALRRRFHFVPFFPNHGPIKGLLERWLERQREPEWVGGLVAHVNDRLEQALGGPHLQIGPSYFMKKGLDETAVRRIWTYNIEPFLEDQFFGNPDQLERFSFDAIVADYLSTADVDTLGDLVETDGPTPTADD